MTCMLINPNRSITVLLALWACSGDGDTQPRVPTDLGLLDGNGQTATVGALLPSPLRVQVTDAAGNPVPDIAVSWVVVRGGGTVAPTTSPTNGDGVATTTFTLGPVEGEQQAQAQVEGLTGSPVTFTAIGRASSVSGLSVVGGGDNVPERFTSDLWVHGNYAYTGTWGFRTEPGDVLKVWSLGSSGAPTLAGSVTVAGIATVSDVQVRDDGQVLVLSGENGPDGGIYLYGLNNPAQPAFLGSARVPTGVHTVTLSSIGGRHYAFAAKNPPQPALLIYDVTAPSAPALVHEEPIPEHYGIHDTFVRDGLAFVFAWDEGVIIYDVGNGMRGGSPADPVEVSRLVTAVNGAGSPAVHNGWWFHNPVSGERRYLFIGQEGPGVIGSESSGDIHVVDVSDLTAPREVAFFHLNGAGVHNFWMDEEKQILYAAYYNEGVIALDVSGTLSGNLSGRLLSRVRPGGELTFTWGVQLANGWLYASDMVTGFWQLSAE
jgi:hypothetical protein